MALRLFDRADAIDLTQAEPLWAAHFSRGSRRSQLRVAPAKAIASGVRRSCSGSIAARCQ